MLVGRSIACDPTVSQEDVRADPGSMSVRVLDAEEQRCGVRAAREQHPAAAPLDGFLKEAMMPTALDVLVTARVGPTRLIHGSRTLIGCPANAGDRVGVRLTSRETTKPSIARGLDS